MTNKKISQLPTLTDPTSESNVVISRSHNNSNWLTSIGEIKRSMGPAFSLTGAYEDKIGFRSLNVVYQNTQNKPVHVIVSLRQVSGAPDASFFCDTSPNPTTRVGLVSLPTTNYEAVLQFVVPANSYYKISAANTTVVSWVERSLSIASAVVSTNPTVSTQVKFDELSGAVTDSVTNTSLTPNGTGFTLNAGTFRDKPYIDLTGTEPYFELPNGFPVVTGLENSFSWSVWVKRNANYGHDEFQVIVNHKHSGGASGLALLLDDSTPAVDANPYRPYIEIPELSTTLFSNNTTSTLLNTWHHLTVVYNGYDVCLYVDGICQSAKVQITEPMRLVSSTPIHVGRSKRGNITGGGNAAISMRDFRIYNKPLTRYEISQIIQSDDYQISGLMRQDRSGFEYYLRNSVEFKSTYSVETSLPLLVKSAPLASSTNYTICGWIYFSDTPSECAVFSAETSGITYRLSLFRENYYWTRLQLKIGGTTITPDAYLYFDHWIFFTVTKSGNNYSMHINDGNQYGKASASGSSATAPAIVPLKFGSATGLPNFSGKIACVSYFDYAISATDADNLFKLQTESNKLPSQSGLGPINEWTMEESTTNAIVDSIGNNDLILSGTTTSINVPWQDSHIALDPLATNPSILWQFDGRPSSIGNFCYLDKISGLRITTASEANTVLIAGPFPGVSAIKPNNGGTGFFTADASAFLNNLTDSDFTIGFYYYPFGSNGAATTPRLLSKTNSGLTTGYELSRQEGPDLVSFSVGTGSALSTITHPYPTNGAAWDYWTIVFVKSTNKLSLFRHGTCLSSTILSGPIAKNTNPVLLGARTGSTELENGYIAQIAFWDRALTDTEIITAQRLKKESSYVNCIYRRKRPIASIAMHPTLQRMVAVEPSDDYSSGFQDGIRGRVIWDQNTSAWRSTGQTARQGVADTIGSTMLFDTTSAVPYLIDSNTVTTHSGAGTGGDNIVCNFGTDALSPTITNDLVGTTESFVDVIATPTHVYVAGDSGWNSTPTGVLFGVEKSQITSNSIDAGTRTSISSSSRLVAMKSIGGKILALLDSNSGTKSIIVFNDNGTNVPSIDATYSLFTGKSSTIYMNGFDAIELTGGAVAVFVSTKDGLSRFDFTTLGSAPTLAWSIPTGDSYGVRIKDTSIVYLGKKTNFVTMDFATGSIIEEITLPDYPYAVCDIAISSVDQKVYAAGYTYNAGTGRIGGAIWAIDSTKFNSPISPLTYISGLTCHLDAGEDMNSVGILSNKVCQWSDVSTGYNHWIQNTDANRPTVVDGVNGINGRRAVKFNGTSSFLQSTFFSSDIITASNYTYFIVASIQSATSDLSAEHQNHPFFVDRLIEPVSASGGYWGTMVRNVGGQLRIVSTIYDGAYKYLDYDFASANVPVLIQVRRTGSSLFMRVGSTPEISVSSGSVGLLSNHIFMGKNHIDNQWLDATVGAAVFFNRNLSDSELNQVRENLSARWGVAI